MPRGNGEVERIHKSVIPMLSKLCQDSLGSWYRRVDSVQQIINNSLPRSTKFSQFQILTGLTIKKRRRELNYNRHEAKANIFGPL